MSLQKSTKKPSRFPKQPLPGTRLTQAERTKIEAEKRRAKKAELLKAGKKPRKYSTRADGKRSSTWWRNKASALCREYLKATVSECQVCGEVAWRGALMPCGGPLEWCHLVGRGERLVMHDPLNYIRMCKHHHYFFTNHPYMWTNTVERLWPGRWERINAIILEGWKPDYEYWVDLYTRQIAELR